MQSPKAKNHPTPGGNPHCREVDENWNLRGGNKTMSKDGFNPGPVSSLDQDFDEGSDYQDRSVGSTLDKAGLK